MPRSKPKIQRNHEIKMELVKVLQSPNGFDTMLLIGALGGGAVAILGSKIKELEIIADLVAEDDETGATYEYPEFMRNFPWMKRLYDKRVAEGRSANDAAREIKDQIAAYAADYAVLVAGGVSGFALWKSYEELQAAFKESPLGASIAFAGAGTSSLCILLLVLRAMNGGKDQGLAGGLANFAAMAAL